MKKEVWYLNEYGFRVGTKADTIAKNVNKHTTFNMLIKKTANILNEEDIKKHEYYVVRVLKRMKKKGFKLKDYKS